MRPILSQTSSQFRHHPIYSSLFNMYVKSHHQWRNLHLSYPGLLSVTVPWMWWPTKIDQKIKNNSKNKQPVKKLTRSSPLPGAGNRGLTEPLAQWKSTRWIPVGYLWTNHSRGCSKVHTELQFLANHNPARWVAGSAKLRRPEPHSLWAWGGGWMEEGGEHPVRIWGA